jgi:hypothetical protein
MTMRRYVLLPAIALLLATAGGCMVSTPPNASVAPATTALTKAAIELQKPPTDRVYFLLFNGGKYDNTGYVARSWAVRVKMNGVFLGVIERNEAMIVEVRPGQYRFEWEEPQGRPLLGTFPTTTIDANGGELIPLQMDSEGWIYKVNRRFNPGQLGSGTPQRLNPDIEIMRPTSCPPALCL